MRKETHRSLRLRKICNFCWSMRFFRAFRSCRAVVESPPTSVLEATDAGSREPTMLLLPAVPTMLVALVRSSLLSKR